MGGSAETTTAEMERARAEWQRPPGTTREQFGEVARLQTWVAALAIVLAGVVAVAGLAGS